MQQGHKERDKKGVIIECVIALVFPLLVIVTLAIKAYQWTVKK